MAPKNGSSRVVVTGATGLLGRAVVDSLHREGFDVVTHSRGSDSQVHVDLSDPQATGELLSRLAPGTVLNLAAWTDVDGCEREPHKAYQDNFQSVHSICSWIATAGQGCHLVHVSTDQVYDGLGPHVESDTRVRNCYAFSKIAAEAVASGVGATIVRTNFFGRSQTVLRKSFTDWLYDRATSGEPFQVFTDVMFNPLPIDTLARRLVDCIEVRPGCLMNLGSRGGVSKADFAFLFAEAAGLDTSLAMAVPISPGTTLLARRPLDMRMNVQRYEEVMHTHLPALEDEIFRIGKTYRELS